MWPDRINSPAGWEHFSHVADIGIRGYGKTLEQAFAQAALGLTAAVTDHEGVRTAERVSVAAFDADQDGVVSAGGVGFDISCGVRTLYTGLTREWIEPVKTKLADLLYREIPVGVGSTGRIHLNDRQMDEMLDGGAQWVVEQGYGTPEDLKHTEEWGRMEGALLKAVSQRAKHRQRQEMGTLGSGNHYLEVQEVAEVYDSTTAGIFGITQGDFLVTIHCGSRGLGHQIGTEYL